MTEALAFVVRYQEWLRCVIEGQARPLLPNPGVVHRVMMTGFFLYPGLRLKSSKPWSKNERDQLGGISAPKWQPKERREKETPSCNLRVEVA
jgi:hypothetical protein